MAGRFILSILALPTSAIPGAAQESGGVRLAPRIKGGPAASPAVALHSAVATDCL
jgi:hypothetical protein